ncbi:MAG: hypothetical protein U0414_06630 [Polyangiaceae bacterium]
MARKPLLVLGLPKSPPHGSLTTTVWFESTLHPSKRAAIAATIPEPLGAEVSWPAAHVMRFGAALRAGDQATRRGSAEGPRLSGAPSARPWDWPKLRQALMSFLEALHAREPIAFAQGPNTFSIVRGADGVAERVVPAVLSYFEQTSANRSCEDDPGVSVTRDCLEQLCERASAGKPTPSEDVWRRLWVPSLGRSFRADAEVTAELLPLSGGLSADSDPRLVLAAFRALPDGADFVPAMAAVVEARSVSPSWFGEMLRDHQHETASRVLRRTLRRGGEIALEDVARAIPSRARQFEVVKRYRELGGPFDRSFLEAAREIAREAGHWEDELSITADLMTVVPSFEAQRMRGGILEEALRRDDAAVVQTQLAHVLAMVRAASAPGSPDLEAALVTPALRELVRRGERAAAAEIAAAYVSRRGSVFETDETLSLVLRALSFDPEREAVEDDVAADVENRVTYHRQLVCEGPPPSPIPDGAPDEFRCLMTAYLAQMQPKASNLLPLVLAAWHARRGRHEDASVLASTALEWGRPVEDVRGEPDLARARGLEPLASRLREAP